MRDDEIIQLLKTETAYLNDDGFTDSVLRQLPAKKQARSRVLASAWLLALGTSALIWFGNHTAVSFFDLSANFIFPASIAFWLFMGLFVYLTVAEELFEV